MSEELAVATRAAVAVLAAGDPGLRRFGAAQHRYKLAPPLDAAQLAAVERELGTSLPEDLRAFATTIGVGGAGPYYGLLDLTRAARFAYDAPNHVTVWRRALPIAHLGCGYAAIVVLDGEARGEVWIDARSIGVVRPICASFTAFYLDWIDRLDTARWPDGFVPPGVCSLSAALGGYLGVCEQQLGVPAGSLAGEPLRDALSQLGPGAIAIAAEGPVGLFADGDAVDPCIVCAQLLDNLAADGLRRDVVAPGLPPFGVPAG